ncbi:hypothetical protein ACWEWG_31390 [Streptomyces sp. NPDC003758]|uniref:Uncharacterized protein n=1 Tax=Streptomyces cynarae TaxID=2981134 RepID=A0ABY6E2Z0_9ACTN|nr:hypothetical protein [Streptomyces cynarae]UXY20627.1 hypothetical protein N8I84_19320 [Streptomyces cynarae]
MTEQTERTEVQHVVVPSEPGTPPLAPPPVKKDRRALRALLRWTAAVAVFAVAGGATAYGITRPERTDLPWLATASDGRWEYPRLVKPPLPSGSPGPFAERNSTGSHYADLRALLLPAPEGARADATLRGTDGWLPARTFLAEFTDQDDRKELGQLLTDNGLRHVAARGWNTPDGTHTRIYLLQFDTAAVADEFLSSKLIDYSAPRYAVRGAAEVARDDYPGAAQVEDVKHQVFAETKPYGAEQVREAYLSAGDTLALIVQSRKGGAKAVPFQQTIVLQSELLG